MCLVPICTIASSIVEEFHLVIMINAFNIDTIAVSVGGFVFIVVFYFIWLFNLAIAGVFFSCLYLTFMSNLTVKQKKTKIEMNLMRQRRHVYVLFCGVHRHADRHV